MEDWYEVLDCLEGRCLQDGEWISDANMEDEEEENGWQSRKN